MNFIPSPSNTDFVYLVGLEHVVDYLTNEDRYIYFHFYLIDPMLLWSDSQVLNMAIIDISRNDI